MSAVWIFGDSYSCAFTEKINWGETYINFKGYQPKHFEDIIKEKTDLVQIWLYDYSYQEKTIIDYVFPKLEETWPQFKLRKNGFEHAVYNKDCFIQDHNDGLHKPRVCILICYLSDDWQKGYGGELYITGVNGEKIEVEPKFGNFTIFNFKEANLQHEVKKILDDNFHRRSLIQIISEEGYY